MTLDDLIRRCQNGGVLDETRREAAARLIRLADAADYARSAIDKRLGDSDPINGSDDPLFVACQKLSEALE